MPDDFFLKLDRQVFGQSLRVTLLGKWSFPTNQSSYVLNILLFVCSSRGFTQCSSFANLFVIIPIRFTNNFHENSRMVYKSSSTSEQISPKILPTKKGTQIIGFYFPFAVPWSISFLTLFDISVSSSTHRQSFETTSDDRFFPFSTYFCANET